MTPPWLELVGNCRRFHTAIGGTFTVHDYRLEADSSNGSSFRRVYRNLGNARAQYRAFVPADGQSRVYRFREGETRSTDIVDLEKQLRAAEYLDRNQFDSRERQPR